MLTNKDFNKNLVLKLLMQEYKLPIEMHATAGLVTKFRLPTEVEWEYAALGVQK